MNEFVTKVPLTETDGENFLEQCLSRRPNTTSHSSVFEGLWGEKVRNWQTQLTDTQGFQNNLTIT